MADNPNEPNEQATAHQDTAPADEPVSAASQTTAETEGADNADTGKALEKRSWHPAFSEGVRLVWDPKENNLEFSPEFAVTSEPIKTDILIVKKDPNVKFEDHIGSSFKEYNFIQFKSCTDNFLLHDLLTEFGYVGTYFGRKSDELLLGLDFKEKTMITVFCSNRRKVRPPGSREACDHLSLQAAHSCADRSAGSRGGGR